MEITLTTPALLFPTISLLLIAYSNRFLAISSPIRDVHRHRGSSDELILAQIESLK